MNPIRIFRIVRTMNKIFPLVDEAVAAMKDGRLTEDDAKVLIIKVYTLLKMAR